MVHIEIFKQLGGNKFLAMTGAKNLVYTGNSLGMKLPRNAGKVTFLTITLNSMDLYTMEFYNVKAKLVNTIENVYCVQLRKFFEDQTGMYTSL
jgi:hypothetical protein